MIVVVILGILASIGIANFQSTQQRAIDGSMKSDLHNAMTAIEVYKVQYGELPPDLASFLSSNGYQLSPGAVWDKFDREMKDGSLSIHMHVEHPESPNKWHAHYPADGGEIEIR